MTRILIVDDEKGITDVLKDFLELEGFETVVRHDVESAREALETESLDAAMVDVFLSDGPVGLDLARYIFAYYPNTRVILMTGYADRAEVAATCLAGAYTCLDKPFDLDDVLRVLGIALEKRSSAA